MKQTFSLLLVGLLALSLAACTVSPRKQPYTGTKCPACGYTFDAPSKN